MLVELLKSIAFIVIMLSIAFFAAHQLDGKEPLFINLEKHQ